MRLIVSFLIKLFLSILALVTYHMVGKAGLLVAAALATVRIYLNPAEMIWPVALLISLVLSQSAGYDFISLVVLVTLACSLVDDHEDTSNPPASEEHIQSPLPLDKKKNQASISTTTSSISAEEVLPLSTPEKRPQADNNYNNSNNLQSTEHFTTPVTSSSSSSATKSKGKKKSTTAKKEDEEENPLQKAKEEARRALQERVQQTQSRLTGGQH